MRARESAQAVTRMKYSLKSLMIFVSLVCVVLGGRIEYLRRQATFHEREAERFRHLESQSPEEIINHLIAMIEHESLATAYREAVYRPWTVVDEDQAKIPEMSPADLGVTIDP